ncbi:GrpB family protein [Microbacterium oryzae]|uniref:GrpB family protein n=1 Tax=Microbacterium oryzae TaxID=743009 RepID=A0A6I6EB61_9MICO|nr:GrpB family protein [Microbacterium oryzae]QGU28288.1 GrpB family protein [Microbacterium oryzae]
MTGELTPEEITTFSDAPAPPGRTPWVIEPRVEEIQIVDPDPRWPERARALMDRIRDALGDRALAVEHVGSTSVPGLPAKPIIDLDLTVADSADEEAWLPALEAAGFVLTVREPWWQEHRCLKPSPGGANVHVFSPGTPELVRHRIFRDWLREDEADRRLYADAKRRAASEAAAQGELMMEYNARKAAVIREIYQRAFRAAELLKE